MYKVFVYDKPIFLIDKLEDETLSEHTLYLRYSGVSELEAMFADLHQGEEVKQMIIHGEDADALWQDFRSLFTEQPAAGGFVRHSDGRVLFIKRNDRWDLPKGKLEEGEDTSIAAVREVEEECGLSGLTLTGQRAETWHSWRAGNEWILKQTVWYDMTTDFDGELVPQIEEGITEVKWLSDSDLDEVRASTYQSLIDVIDA